MVPLEQEDQSQEEDHIPLLEGFQWESLMDLSTLGPSRKRSLSESSLAPPSAHSLLTPQTSKQTGQEGAACPDRRRFSTSEKMDCQHEPERGDETSSSLQRCDSVLGDSSSGTELCEGQGPGKRRRAAGVRKGRRPLVGKQADLSSSVLQEGSSTDGNKRRKVRAKKGWWTCRRVTATGQAVSASCFMRVCRAPADRPAAGRVSAGGRAESLPADPGRQPDPSPGGSAGRLHGGSASRDGQTASTRRLWRLVLLRLLLAACFLMLPACVC